MEEIILKTKLVLPRLSDHTLYRDRLIDLVKSNIEKKIVLICAAAGYGKTTLLAQFANKHNFSYAWYQLDRNDQDLSSFMQYIIEGIRRFFPQFGKRTQGVINYSTEQKTKPEILVGTFINELMEIPEQRILLIFDDFQEIYDAKNIIAGFEYLLHHLPPNVSLVVSARSNPPFSLDRLQLKNEVLEITQEELKFNKDEIKALCEQNFGYTPRSPELSKLHTNSEGWITCLQFLVQPATTKTILTNSKEPLSERLHEFFDKEIYAKLDDNIKFFLAASSVLDYLSPEACDFVMSRHDSRQILNNLHSKQLFISMFDAPKLQYSYHHLFRNFLTDKLKETNRYQKIQTRAGLFAEQKEILSKALYHYHEAQNFKALARLIEESEDNYMSIAKLELFKRYIQDIPTSIINQSPRLLRFSAWLCSSQGDARCFRIYSGRAKRCAARNKNYYELFRTIHSQLANRLMHGEYKDIRAQIKKILRSQHLKNIKLRLRFFNLMGIAYLYEGRIEEAIEFYKKILKLGKNLKYEYHTNTALYNIADANRDIGNFAEAEHYLKNLTNRSRANPSPVMIMALNALGSALMLQGELLKARKVLAEAIDLAQLHNDKYMTCSCHLVLAENMMFSEENTEAEKLLNSAVNLALEINNNILLADCWAMFANLFADRGDLFQARKYIDKALGLPVPSLNKTEHMMTKAAVELSLKNVKTAAGVLNRILPYLKKSKHKMMIFCLEMARLQLLKQNETKALDCINEAVELATKNSYDFLFGHKLQHCPEIIRFIRTRHIKSPLLQHILLTLPYADIIATPVEPNPKDYNFVIRLFGRIEIFKGRDEIKSEVWRTKKFQELFGFLVAHNRQTITREKIIAAFWPDHTPTMAKQLFYNALYWIRKIVGKNIIVYNDLGYALSSKYKYWIDCEKFENFVKEGDKSVQDNNLIEGLIKYEEGLGIYRGGFLDDFYSDWCTQKRRYYEETYLDLVRKLAHGHFKLVNYQKALKFINLVISKNPYDDDAYCLAMHCYAKLNNFTDLHTCFANLEKVLAKDLKTTPQPETLQLYKSLTKQKDA